MFNIGDKIECIKDYLAVVTCGKVYTVVDPNEYAKMHTNLIYNPSNYTFFICDGNYIEGVMHHFFKLVDNVVTVDYFAITKEICSG